MSVSSKITDDAYVLYHLDRYTLNVVLNVINLNLRDLHDELEEAELHGSAGECHLIQTKIDHYEEIFDKIQNFALYGEE